MEVLADIVIGSRLYGTNNDASDYDILHVLLPEYNELLLGNVVITNTHHINNNNDYKQVYVQRFIDRFFNGSPQEVEIANAISNTSTNGICKIDFIMFCKKLIDNTPVHLNGYEKMFEKIFKRLLVTMEEFAISRVTKNLPHTQGARSIYHTLRIMDDYCSLNEKGVIDFPVRTADLLKDVKNEHESITNDFLYNTIVDLGTKIDYALKHSVLKEINQEKQREIAIDFLKEQYTKGYE